MVVILFGRGERTKAKAFFVRLRKNVNTFSLTFTTPTSTYRFCWAKSGRRFESYSDNRKIPRHKCHGIFLWSG